VRAIQPLWRYLDSPGYKVDDDSKEKIRKMTETMNTEVKNQREIRDGVLQKISLLFANSTFRTRWFNTLGF